MSENDKKNNEIENNNITEDEWVELELSPQRNKIFKLGFGYLIILLILAFPLYILAKVLGNATGVSKSVYAIVFYILALIPSYKIWKIAQKEVGKHEDYGYDSKLKFSFYTGMIGTTGFVTLCFVALFTGAIWLFKPNPFNAKILSIGDTSLTVKTFQKKYVIERPSIRPIELQRVFGTVSYDMFKFLIKANVMNLNITEQEMKNQYKELMQSEEPEPNRVQIFNELSKYMLRQALYLEGKEIAKQDPLFQNLINVGNIIDTAQILSRVLNYQMVYSKQQTYRPVLSDLQLIQDTDKNREQLNYQRILIFNRNHENNAEKAFEQAQKAVKALRTGLSWDETFTRFNQKIPGQDAQSKNEVYTHDKANEIIAPFFNKPAGFISEPIKFPQGYLIIKVVGTKKLSDEELIKNEHIINKIKNVYAEKFQKEYDKILENKYRASVKLNVDILFKDSESKEHFLIIADEIHIPVVFFWKNMNEEELKRFTANTNQKKQITEYIENQYVKPLMTYLEGKHLGLLNKDYVKYEISSAQVSRYIQAYINWHAIPKKVDPVVNQGGENALKEFYTNNPRYFMQQQPMQQQENSMPKPFNLLNPAEKENAKRMFRGVTTRDILMPYITKTLYPKFRIKLEKKFFKGKIPPEKLNEF